MIKKIRSGLVQSRMFMIRAYSWIQVPLMVSGMSAILKPYINQYIQIDLLPLVLIVLFGTLLVGWLERKLGVWSAEMDYNTHYNPYFKRRFDRIEKIILDGRE